MCTYGGVAAPFSKDKVKELETGWTVGKKTFIWAEDGVPGKALDSCDKCEDNPTGKIGSVLETPTAQ